MSGEGRGRKGLRNGREEGETRGEGEEGREGGEGEGESEQGGRKVRVGGKGEGEKKAGRSGEMESSISSTSPSFFFKERGRGGEGEV